MWARAPEPGVLSGPDNLLNLLFSVWCNIIASEGSMILTYFDTLQMQSSLSFELKC